MSGLELGFLSGLSSIVIFTYEKLINLNGGFSIFIGLSRVLHMGYVFFTLCMLINLIST